MKLFSQDKKIESLKRAPLFEDLSRKELVQLARLTDDVEVPAGKVLCKEGDLGLEFFVLVDGKVDVARNGRRVATLGAGDFVGEISLLEPTPRTATVTAKTALRFFVLTPKAFQQVLDENPSVSARSCARSPDESLNSHATRRSHRKAGRDGDRPSPGHSACNRAGTAPRGA